MPKRRKTVKKTSAPPKEDAYKIIPENPNARALMLGGVIVVTAIILILWGWAMKVRITSFSIQATPENKVIENSKNEFNNLFNKQQNGGSIIKSQIGNAIKQLAASSTSPTGSVQIATASTTAISTSTIIESLIQKINNKRY